MRGQTPSQGVVLVADLPEPIAVRAPSPRLRTVPEPTLLLWALFILLTPLYTRSRGGLQVADLALGAALLAHVSGARMGRPVAVHAAVLPALRAGVGFAFYALLVGAVWAFVLEDVEPLLSGTYYAYGIGTVALVASLHLRFGDRLLTTTRWAVYASLVWIAVVVVLDPSEGIRSNGPFNNPNQLGYYALLAQSALWVINAFRAERHADTRWSLLAEAGAWALTGLLVLASSSVGALAGVLLLFALNLVGRRRGAVQILLAVAAIVPLIIWTSGDTSAFDPVMDRFERKTDLDEGDSALRVLDDRGYDRIAKYPEHLLFGAGEGGRERFPESDLSGELHSSPGTLLFSYGVIGTGLFVLLLVRTSRGAGVVASLPLIPVIAYSLSHQGLRFRLWWVLLALLVVGAVVRARAGPGRPAPVPR